jgi:hypothetical protein
MSYGSGFSKGGAQVSSFSLTCQFLRNSKSQAVRLGNSVFLNVPSDSDITPKLRAAGSGWCQVELNSEESENLAVKQGHFYCRGFHRNGGHRRH